jgi:hypothetical protein
VCWAVSRSYAPDEVEPIMQQLAPALLTAAVLDREVSDFTALNQILSPQDSSQDIVGRLACGILSAHAYSTCSR